MLVPLHWITTRMWLTYHSYFQTGVFVLGTNIIPPLLPTVFVVSVGISTKRLQKKRITCTNPEGILAAGMVDAAFFDKTGTLTKQGMDFISLDSGFGVSKDKRGDHFGAQIRLGMAVCHTLTTTTSEGEIVGNQVDKVSFESYNGKNDTVPKKYEFDTHRATQSVIIEGEDGTKLIFVKGSPEAIRALFRESTVPNTLDERVRMSAKSGVYQITIVFKDFDFQDSIAEVSRDDVEKLLTFGGFINFQNVMKEDTPEVLEELVAGDVSVAMITGDSVLTGICIARESGMIKAGTQVILGSKAVGGCMIEWWTDADTEESVDMPSGALMGSLKSNFCLAVSGEVWALLRESDPTYASMIAKHVRVFVGRCNPT
jgi:magnesium-transporting ATPase (P-type)